MTEKDSALQKGRQYAAKRVTEIWDNLGKNNLWKRILKNVIATTLLGETAWKMSYSLELISLLVSICLIPGSRTAIGKAAYLGAITTVFGHPGRRFGQMAEALILAVSGTVLGVAWSLLGLYLGSLVIKDNPPAAYAIRGAFLAIVVLIHGYLRSRTPRLFIFVLLLIIVSVVTLISTAKAVTTVGATQILYPILIAVGCIILVNLCVFPEFSSRFLGQMTIDTLSDTAKALENAGHYFVEAEASTAVANNDSQPDSGEAQMSPPPTKERKGTEQPGTQVPKSSQTSMFIQFEGLIRRLFGNGTSAPADEIPENIQRISLTHLTDQKAQIRKKLGDCKAAQQECNFEIAVSVLPPRDMKPISVRAMKRLVANTIAVIGACESKFALLGAGDDDEEVHIPECDKADIEENMNNGEGATGETNENVKRRKLSAIIEQDKAELEMIKPKREIEFGDARLLRYLLHRVAKPYEDLHQVVAWTIEVVTACVAYAYDVPTLQSGAHVPKGILLEELDLHMDNLELALIQFDIDAASALEGAATMQELDGKEPDIMPREEVFLMSSFMLNVRQAASHIEEMLKHSRELVERRQQRNGRRRLYAPRIKWSNWLYTGSAEDEAMPTPARKANQEGNMNEDDEDDGISVNSTRSLYDSRKQGDLEKDAAAEDQLNQAPKERLTRKKSQLGTATSSVKISRTLRLRGQAADTLEWIQHSEDLLYAIKLGVAVFLVLWPAFIWNTWYSLNRGIWAALQLILITEVSIGTSVRTFVLRGIGTTLGCIWGWAALEARNGNRIVCAVMIFIALFPCAYVQLGTKYPKAGIVSIVSICVVTLATELDTVPGTATENFLKRYIAFMIGGVVALIVQIVLLPVKARTRLVESIATALQQISKMERCIAFRIEEGVKIDVYAAENISRFENACGKANGALSAAETFLPFCSNEPRIKGSFEGLALIYGEILFVLHQIADRMENMLQLRAAYGSGPLEELNAEIYPYRRNVAGSITLTLFAIHGALTTKLPLPQFLPSARLAHLRMINRVREVVLEKVSEGQDDHKLATKLARQRAVRRKYMSWNASSAAQAEIIEFLEELIDLTKLLVGANEFRSGLLTRPTYHDYAEKREQNREEAEEDVAAEARDEIRVERVGAAGLTRRRRGTALSARSDEDVPASLRRIQSRKIEAGLKRQRTNESWGQDRRI